MNPTGAGPGGRWSQAAVAGKTLEVQRSQVDEVFNSLRSGDELDETEAGMSKSSFSLVARSDRPCFA